MTMHQGKSGLRTEAKALGPIVKVENSLSAFKRNVSSGLVEVNEDCEKRFTLAYLNALVDVSSESIRG